MKFDELYTLPRAGRYISPINSNDRLPIVYGDLTDGSNGNWVLPCIDTVAFVYAFAAHEALSVANGNSINIYADGELVNPANYTFDESNDYEGEGAIATITFDADQGNAIITARGMGKDDGAGSLMENIIDILYDFLTVESDLVAADFDATRLATAKAIFNGQGYKAAGVIDQDAIYWEILQEMMGSFLGNAWLTAEYKLALEIDDGMVPDAFADLIPRSSIVLKNARQRLISLINQCPASYAYNYAILDFHSHSNGETTKNSISQGIYGIREPASPFPFYWCRDLTSIEVMQAIITDKYGDPIWDIEFNDLSLKRIQLDVEDVIVATFDCLYDAEGDPLYNEYMKILTMRPDLGKENISFRAMDLGTFMLAAYYANGAMLMDGSIHAGYDRDMTDY
jgi:hypothetical protein